ncbi:dual specificity mitogen-activated protein kinase kinase 1 [Colletotrichum sojae]|uniref:Dual specificity mitogen-activated protein kinase kinase 1 n=1 Tax=Colletotrichum sojae TaxID=2175907 RepID=A0A8H6JFQ0_9PEZI|nr:dual specificity mitogen-activated protein kinase kinase 1 [Colletotrichum sojae]
MRNYHNPYYDTLRGDEDEMEFDPPKLSTKEALKTEAREAIKRKVMPDNIFRKALERCGLPYPNDPLASKTFLRDAIFPRISRLLEERGKQQWGLSPRTFSILYVLNIPDLMDYFIAQGRTDRYLPYSEANLPNCLSGGLRSQFIKLLNLVRCHREDISELEEGGKHISLPMSADAYFNSRQTLGQGRFAVVDKVDSLRTAQTYARKQIRRGESMLDDKTQLQVFERELASLKALSHRHVVKLVGSYTDPTNLGLIMSPIADTDLHEYLRDCEASTNSRKAILRGFFGCLTTASAYIHAKKIRHKDIKPKNILVKDNQVFLADFGTSRMCLDESLTTNGVSKEGTLRYWAPEVGDNANRNQASDVWSLGCVFLEMATTLFGRTQVEMQQFFASNGTENHLRLSLNPVAIQKWTAELRKSSTDDSSVLDWTAWMLQPKPENRPLAAELRGTIIDLDSKFDYICHECASPDGMGDSKPPAPAEPYAATVLHTDHDSLPHATEKTSHRVPEKSATRDKMSPLNSEDQKGGVKKSPEVIKKPKTLAKEPTAPRKTTDARPPRSVTPKPRVRFAGIESDQNRVEDLGTGDEEGEDRMRFFGLPQDRRPKPTNHQSETSSDEDDATKDAEFIIPEPIKPPPFYRKDCAPLPNASLVPSYVLAGTNRFTGDELEGSSPDTSTTNVFLYGRLMFPSVLHAIADQSTAGAYSTDLHRRIIPSSDDWSHADHSIQRASEIMTPAKLRGYDRWRPRGFQCAVLQKSTYTRDILSKPRVREAAPSKPPGEVVGFLLVGVTKEVVRYLDLLFARDERDLQDMRLRSKEEDINEEDAESSPLRRKSVHVEVELSTGEITQVEAHTYIWKHRTADLGQFWDEGHFIRGSQFQRLVERDKNWRVQEKTLARSMHISFALVGDYLCSTVVTGDTDELQSLLDQGWGPDAPCRYYGNVLHAAVVTGNEDMVDLLLDHGANVDRNDSRYGSALIAAAFASRKAITRRLLRQRADVFAWHPIHGEALYQAIGQSDYAIAEMLLEDAAWLTQDWGEICDLANEVGDSEMQSLLRQYDVRRIHKRSLPALRKIRNSEELEQSPSYTRIMGAILQKCIAVQTMSGSWKGRKGVAVTVAALNAGAPTSILPLIRSAVGPVRALIDELRRRGKDRERPVKSPLKTPSKTSRTQT